MNIRCVRCGYCCREIDGEPAERCWFCGGPLCWECWEDVGHCGHSEAYRRDRELVNRLMKEGP